MRHRLGHVLLGLSFFALPATGQVARFVPLGFLEGGNYSGGHGLSADGRVVVGRSQNPHPTEFANQAVRWEVSNRVEAILNPVVDVGTNIASASNAGGTIWFGATFEIEYSTLFRSDTSGAWTTFAADSGFNSIGGVSADGSVLAVSTDDTYGNYGAHVGAPEVGFRDLGSLSGGTDYAAALGISADGHVVVGEAGSSQGRQAFRWTDAGGMQGLGFLASYPGASSATDASEDGGVVVGGSGLGIEQQAFRWTQSSGLVGLGHLPGTPNSAAVAVSDDGKVVVGSSGGTPFVWTVGLGMVSLRDNLVSNGAGCLRGWTLTNVTAISADGNAVTGSAVNPIGQTEAYVAYLDVPVELAIGNTECAPAAANSTGAPARLSVLGSDCVAEAELSIAVDDLPPGVWGILLMAPAAAHVPNPFGEGYLCLGGGVRRLGSRGFPADASGHVARALDVATTPILAGTSWHFQAYYRDLDPAPTSNLSDSVAVSFR